MRGGVLEDQYSILKLLGKEILYNNLLIRYLVTVNLINN